MTQTVDYAYLETNIIWQAPCVPMTPTTTTTSTMTIYLYIYRIDFLLVEGPDTIPKTMQVETMLPFYNKLYPYLKIYTNVDGNKLSFPSFSFECVVESESGNKRFQNKCIEAVLKLHPEWEDWFENRIFKDGDESIIRGSVKINNENAWCVIVDVTTAPLVDPANSNIKSNPSFSKSNEIKDKIDVEDFDSDDDKIDSDDDKIDSDDDKIDSDDDKIDSDEPSESNESEFDNYSESEKPSESNESDSESEESDMKNESDFSEDEDEVKEESSTKTKETGSILSNIEKTEIGSYVRDAFNSMSSTAGTTINDNKKNSNGKNSNNTMKWAVLDELIYSPSQWTPDPIIKEMFKQHTMMRHIMIQHTKNEWKIGPFPFVVHSYGSISPDSFAELPQLDENWGWIYKYTSTPTTGSRPHLTFFSNVYYNIDKKVPIEKQKELWEKSSYMYMNDRTPGFSILASDPLIYWISRDPLRAV